ncbi:MAG: DUF4198 domain-containing protein [Agitococcus sp.]|nr:DUF4198 domain-containing protein [Agitococcus sp.]
MSAVRKKVVLAIVLLTVLPSAQAHRQWLLPSSTQIEAKEAWVTIDAATSENLFDFDSNALALDGLQITAPDGAIIVPERTSKGRFRSSADVKLLQKGTYKISLVSQSVMANYTLNGEQKRWRGTEDKMAAEIPAEAKDLKVSRTFNRLDTFVTSGKPSASVLNPVGQGLELVAVSHPNELFAKEKSTFNVLFDGKPLANAVVTIAAGGVRYRGVLNEITATTNAQGEFNVTWPFAEMYWLKLSYPSAPTMKIEGAPAEMPEKRYSYAATLEVLPQ